MREANVMMRHGQPIKDVCGVCARTMGSRQPGKNAPTVPRFRRRSGSARASSQTLDDDPQKTAEEESSQPKGLLPDSVSRSV